MERTARKWKHCRRGIGLVVGIAAIVIFCGVAAADPATLTVTPSPTVKRGDVLTFQAVVFHDPAFPRNPAPGTPMKIGVFNPFFGWVTETKTIEYVGMGSVTVNFTKKFTVPSNLQSGAVLEFFLSWAYKQEGVTVYTVKLAQASVTVLVAKLKAVEEEDVKVKKKKVPPYQRIK